MAAPWTNRDQSVFVPLNDYTATVIGMVRDNVPFNTLLSADLVYIGDGKSGEPAYSASNNAMYDALDANNVDLSVHLVSNMQSSVEGIPSTATAGVLTTRGAASAFFINGTNRAMFRFTMLNHLCNDMQLVMDITRPPDRIRQDVTRSPGGVSTLFLTNCIGCHSGMDPMAQAFAYYNFSATDPTMTDTTGQIVYTAGQVQPKYSHQQHQFPARLRDHGRQLEQPLARGAELHTGMERNASGQRQRRQVSRPGIGKQRGVRELPSHPGVQGCVPARTESPQADFTQVNSMISSFQSHNYSLRQVFAEGAAYCMGN